MDVTQVASLLHLITSRDNEDSRAVLGAGGDGGGGGRGAAARGRRLQQAGHQAGAGHSPHPQGCRNTEGTRRRRDCGIRVHSRQPKDQPIRDPRRPATFRSDQQPAVSDRPRGAALGRPAVGDTCL